MSDHTVMIIWVMKLFFCTVLLCILATSLTIFQFVVIHTVKGFVIVNKAEVDVLLELLLFLWPNDPTDVGNLISGFSAFCKSTLNIWNFMVHAQLKPGLENFEHYLTSVWDECNCAVVWAFFGIAWTSLVAQTVKRLAYNVGDLGSVPGLGRSSGEGNGNPL